MNQQSENVNKQSVNSSNIGEIVDVSELRRIPSDTGSPEVQIAQITGRLKVLTSHFKNHKKDFHSQTGLIKMISRRKKLLSYLRKHNFKRYQFVVRHLGLRK